MGVGATFAETEKTKQPHQPIRQVRLGEVNAALARRRCLDDLSLAVHDDEFRLLDEAEDLRRMPHGPRRQPHCRPVHSLNDLDARLAFDGQMRNEELESFETPSEPAQRTLTSGEEDRPRCVEVSAFPLHEG